MYYYFSVYVNLFKELMLRHKKNRSFEAKADAKVQQIPEPTKLLGTFFRKNLKFSCFRTKYDSIFRLYLINII